MVIDVILAALWLMLPAYFANMSAVLTGGGTPIDFGKNWRDGRRILGDNKTWRGLAGGTAIGMTVGVLQAGLLSLWNVALPSFGAFPSLLLVLFGLSFGALFGDVVKSFFKRRLAKTPGSRWPVFDQLDFVVGAWLIAFLLAPSWFIETFIAGNNFWIPVAILIISPTLHIVVNFIGYKIGKKDVPW